MTRSGLSVVLLLSLFGAISALSLLPKRHCKELRTCNNYAVCGIRTCTIQTKCCTTSWFTGRRQCKIVNTRKDSECGPFHCENGGTRTPLRGKRAISDSGCEIPTPRCACPLGFSGQCCQDLVDPCTFTKCGAGQVCKTEQVICKKAPCPLKAVCVQDAGICPLFPNTITTCELKLLACGNHSHCSNGELCCKRGCGKECMKALPTGTTGCARVTCRPGTVCRELAVLCLHNKPCEMQVVCVPEKPKERPGRCPRYAKIGRLPCLYNCTDDSECKGKQKCCDKYCSRVCVDPEPLIENPCAVVDCGPGKVCVPEIVRCLIPPCDNFRCIPETPVEPPCPLVLCPKGKVCKKVPVWCLNPPCPEQYKCVVPDPVEPPCPLVLCPEGKVCKKVPIPCLIPPCPEQYKCVVPDPCEQVRCPRGKVCKNLGDGNTKCVSAPVLESGGAKLEVALRSCPKFPGLITTCQITEAHCFSDKECGVGQRCCPKGCGRECVNV